MARPQTGLPRDRTGASKDVARAREDVADAEAAADAAAEERKEATNAPC